MFKIAQTFAGAATLVLAALPIAALSTAAHAAPAVQVADLNLGGAAAQSVLSQRVDASARSFCRNHMVTTGSRANDRATCMAGVRAEVAEKVVAAQPIAFARR